MSSLDRELAEILGIADLDDITVGFRDRYGCYSEVEIEEDPEMLEYAELVSLGESLGGGRGCW